MTKVLGMMGDFAVAEAAKLCNPDVVAAFPITPQTIIVERLSEFVADGELDCEYITVESEHSAMSACYGASSTGARVYTATASQGVALMCEILYLVASARFPVVMTVVNRALSGPISIWCDHNDAMLARDSGWIQWFVEDCQEAYDSTIQAFRVGEDRRVSLPVMVCLDGFILSHSIEPVEIIEPTTDKKTIDGFLPRRDPLYRLDIDAPIAVGTCAFPEYYMDIKKAQNEAMRNAKDVMKEVVEEFGDRWGRYYPIIEPYKMDDAEAALVTMGSFTGTAKATVDEMREEGERVGLVKLRCFRPFPIEEMRIALRDVQACGVVDRAVSFGSFAPSYAETSSAMNTGREGPLLRNFIAGLGGRDVTVADFKKMYDLLYDDLKKGVIEQPITWYGIRKEV
ncbi:MAG: pyruvate ferredoxin oxidoreductase [Promethearchaeota archaeon]